MESNVIITCRKKDLDLVSSILPNVQALYKSALPGHDVNAVIDRNNFLPETGAGGIQVTAKDGRLKCSNTLEARLEMLFTKVRPTQSYKGEALKLSTTYRCCPI